ncbi:mitofusin [Kalmusia sp. IMI 367209]|nr:mitofusin [Kalmusia sp. IMI 367209]
MEVRRDPRQFLFFIILLLLINSPEPQNPGFNTRSRYDEVIHREWEQLDLLNTTRYGDFDAQNHKWLNITGLRKEDAFTWEVLGDVKSRARERMRGVLGERTQGWLDGKNEQGDKEMVYRNISGFVQGEWVRSPLSSTRYPIDMLNATGSIPDFALLAEFDRNLTGTHGMIRLHFAELDGRQRTDDNRTISEIKAKVVIEDADSWGDNWWEFNLNGVHYPRFGGAVMSTTSERIDERRFGGVFALPHLQLSPHLYSRSQELLNRTIHETIEHQIERAFPVWNPWSSAVDGAAEGALGANHCEFVLFLQEAPIQFEVKRNQQPLTGQPDLDWLEQELRYPTGARVPPHSAMAMSMVGFSPDCGFVIESKGPPDFPPSEAMHLLGSKTEEFNEQAKQSILAFSVTLAFQLVFIIKQAKEAATPSTRNRISFYTIAMMALGDGFMFLALVFLHLFLGTSQLALFTIAFLALFSVVLELRFFDGHLDCPGHRTNASG